MTPGSWPDGHCSGTLPKRVPTAVVISSIRTPMFKRPDAIPMNAPSMELLYGFARRIDVCRCPRADLERAAIGEAGNAASLFRVVRHQCRRHKGQRLDFYL